MHPVDPTAQRPDLLLIRGNDERTPVCVNDSGMQCSQVSGAHGDCANRIGHDVRPSCQISERLSEAWEARNGQSGRPPVLSLMGSLVTDEAFKSRTFLEKWVSR